MLTLVNNAKGAFTNFFYYLVLGSEFVPLSWYCCDLLSIKH